MQICSCVKCDNNWLTTFHGCSRVKSWFHSRLLELWTFLWCRSCWQGVSVYLLVSLPVCVRVCVTAGGLTFLFSASRENPCCHLRIRIRFSGWVKDWWIKSSLTNTWQSWKDTMKIFISAGPTQCLQRLWSRLYGLEENSRKMREMKLIKLKCWQLYWLLYIFHISA